MKKMKQSWPTRRKKLAILRQIAKTEKNFYAHIPRIIRTAQMEKLIKDEKKKDERLARLEDQKAKVEAKFFSAAEARGDQIDDSFEIVRTRLEREDEAKAKKYFSGWRNR